MKIKTTIIILFQVFLGSCASSRQSVRIEEKTETASKLAISEKDSFTFDRWFDSSKECRQQVDMDVIEYYPQTYIDSGGAVVQMVKIKKTAKAKKEEVEIVSKTENIEKNSITSDTSYICQKTDVASEQSNKSKRTDNRLYLVILLLIIIAVYLGYRRIR